MSVEIVWEKAFSILCCCARMVAITGSIVVVAGVDGGIWVVGKGVDDGGLVFDGGVGSVGCEGVGMVDGGT